MAGQELFYVIYRKLMGQYFSLEGSIDSQVGQGPAYVRGQASPFYWRDNEANRWSKSPPPRVNPQSGANEAAISPPPRAPRVNTQFGENEAAIAEPNSHPRP